ncbi:MAG: serine/threonine-protein kinase [Pirellulaceae bacterium]|nr:serine/threonine-protein kinase [Pirellulaceae bacterium]
MANDSNQRLGKYLLKSRLGQGGMGVVYLATDQRLARDVALKILPKELAANPDAVRRFLREARVAARLNHPNVVAIHDVDQQRGVCFLVLELMSGGNAQELLGRGPLGWREATRIIAETCRGLAAAHDAGLLHRDIKPANIMLTASGHVKLADFGLAKIEGDAASGGPLTKSSAVFGTPQYMSPEQCQGETLDPRSDIYSLGATWFALLTGQTPFVAEQPVQMMFAHCSKPPPDPRTLRPEIPAECAQVVLKCLEKSRSERYASASDLLAALDKLLADAPTLRLPGDSLTKAGLTAASEPLPPAPTQQLDISTLGGTAASTKSVSSLWKMPRLSRRGWLAGAATGAGLFALGAGWGVRQWLVGSQARRPIDLVFAAAAPSVSAPIRGLAFATSGGSLVTGSLDGGVRAWSSSWSNSPSQVTREFTGTSLAIRAVAVGEDWLVAGGDAKTLWKWTSDETAPRQSITDFIGEISALAISPDGSRLAVGTYAEVRLYDCGGPELKLMEVLGTSTTGEVKCYMVKSVAFSSDSRWLAATSWADKTVAVWNAVDGTLSQAKQNLGNEPLACAFVPTTEELVFGASHDGLAMWNLAQDVVRPIAESEGIEVRSLAITPDGASVIAIGQWDGDIRIYDLAGRIPPRTIRKSTGSSAAAVAISPDGKLLATAGGDEGQPRGYLHLWSVEPGKQP